MKILFCGLKYEHGRPELGLSSIEYQTFFDVLKRMPGMKAEFFGMDEVMAEVGREKMNKHLINRVEEIKPDLLFCLLFTDEIKKETIDYITRKTQTKTFNWFADDHWRLPVFSRFWAPLFTLIGTTDSQAPAKYRAFGIKNVIKTQWAANTAAFHPASVGEVVGLPNKNSEITFVGKNYGNRQLYITALQKKGLPAKGYGKGWDGGVVSLEKMLEIFSTSKINLNFTESYFNWPKQLAKLFIQKTSGGYKLNIQYPISNIRSLAGAKRPQIKARTFEISACGGFLLTGEADNIRDYYIPGKEIAVFKNQTDLATQCKYYLEHDNERQAIANAGYERTIKEHTYEKRFMEIFREMELID